jgi:hypothetical protein
MGWTTEITVVKRVPLQSGYSTEFGLLFQYTSVSISILVRTDCGECKIVRNQLLPEVIPVIFLPGVKVSFRNTWLSACLEISSGITMSSAGSPLERLVVLSHLFSGSPH